ncbi:MAG: histidine phosphatase family protein [Rhabdochlamydiaceae bacterium]|nr:histidine phosphatase family protein [Rhabdochlamydiaceae bacterium]
MRRLALVRHGETQWALSGKHTGKTDIPLTEKGIEQAQQLKEVFTDFSFEKAFVSPLQRAKKTFLLSGLSIPHEWDEDLYEWDYGDYEGLTSAEIRAKNPSWSLFDQGPPNGETPQEIKARADRMISKALQYSGDVVFFSSGHILRTIASRFLGLPVSFGKHLTLRTGSFSLLGYEHQNAAILLWNEAPTFPC